jgi:hypothetical protein
MWLPPGAGAAEVTVRSYCDDALFSRFRYELKTTPGGCRYHADARRWSVPDYETGGLAARL